MKKRWILFLLAISMALGCVLSGCTGSKTDTSSDAEETESSETAVPTVSVLDSNLSAWDFPEDAEDGRNGLDNGVYYYNNFALCNGTSTDTLDFQLNEVYPYAVMQICNTGTEKINVVVERLDEQVGDTISLEAGESSRPIYLDSNGSYGNYYVEVFTEDGTTLDGTATVLAGTREAAAYQTYTPLDISDRNLQLLSCGK